MEFQAVVICSPGKKLHPITVGTCKSLLPVGNKPLVQYVVEWCDRAGFASTTVAVSESEYEQVEATCHEFNWKVSLFKVPDSSEAGQVLKLLEAAGGLNAQCDIALLSCDFLTDIDPEQLISAVRSQEDNMGITGFYYRNNLESLDLKTLNPDVLLHSTPLSSGSPGSPSGPQLLLDSYERHQVKEAKWLKPRMSMLWQYPKVVATMDLLRSSIFFMRRSVLSFDDIDFNKPLPKLVRDMARRTWCHRNRHETVVMEVLPSTNLMVRANTLPAYMEANRQKLREQAKQTSAPRQRQPGQAVIGNDSMVGSDTVVGDKSSVKRTAIGNNCEVGKKCRLNGCVILDNVVIGNDVTLENCLIGARAVIEQKSKLIGCSVEGGYTVISDTEAKNEVLKGLSMEGIDDDEFGDMYESISEDSDEDSDSNSESGDDGVDYDDEDDLFDRS